jgi:hypothetical protein
MNPATLAFVFIAFFGNPGQQGTAVVVPGIYDENECHKLAIKLNAPHHGCYEYRIASPHTDVADAVQDELQDSGIIR